MRAEGGGRLCVCVRACTGNWEGVMEKEASGKGLGMSETIYLRTRRRICRTGYPTDGGSIRFTLRSLSIYVVYISPIRIIM